MSDTNSFLDQASVKAWLESFEHPSSLPCAIFSADGTLQTANPRMRQLLGFDARDKTHIKMNKKDIRDLWPFFNEHKGGPAVFDWIFENVGSDMTVEASLKTFKLYVKKYTKKGYIGVVTELLRGGDLLQDNDARQALFRSLAHEIRTALTALEGYQGMLKSSPLDEIQLKVLERMDINHGRLRKVVDRLNELKQRLTDGY